PQPDGLNVPHGLPKAHTCNPVESDNLKAKRAAGLGEPGGLVGGRVALGIRRRARCQREIWPAELALRHSITPHPDTLTNSSNPLSILNCILASELNVSSTSTSDTLPAEYDSFTGTLQDTLDV